MIQPAPDRTRRLVNLGDETITRPQGNVIEPFTPENIAETFDVLNPETGETTGQTATYMDVYVLLHSLYYHVAQKRDAAAPPTP